MKYPADATDPQRPHASWRVEYEGPPLPSGLPQCFLSMTLDTWGALEADRRLRVQQVVDRHSLRTKRELQWARHRMVGQGSALDDVLVSVGPIAYGGELHTDIVSALARDVPLLAFDPIRGIPCPARPPREKPRTAERDTEEDAIAADVTGWRVVGFHGHPAADELPLRCEPIVVNRDGQFVDAEGRPREGLAGYSGALYGQDTAAGPWPHAPGRVVFVLGDSDARDALGAIITGAHRAYAGVGEFLWAIERARETGDFEGWVAQRAPGLPGAVLWYASKEQADALMRLLSDVCLEHFWRHVIANDAAALTAASWRLQRAADGLMDEFYALAGLEVGGMAHKEVVALLDARMPQMNPGDRTASLRAAVRWVRNRWRDRS